MLGVSGAVAAFVGAWTASQLTEWFLTVMFGVVTLLGAVRMLTARKVIAREEKKASMKISYYRDRYWGFSVVL